MKPPECEICKCSEEKGCAGGCFWVTPALCSRCAIDQLRAAGLDTRAMLSAVQFWRRIGYEPGSDPTMVPVMVPLAVIATEQTCMRAWAHLVGCGALMCPATLMPQLEAVAQQTHLAVQYWDVIARGAAVPSFEQLQEMMGAPADADAGDEEPPAPPRLWRPGDPIT
jgi:hypothetical protein